MVPPHTQIGDVCERHADKSDNEPGGAGDERDDDFGFHHGLSDGGLNSRTECGSPAEFHDNQRERKRAAKNRLKVLCRDYGGY
ncbi:hypothetical protein GCM10009677_58720 [Sphaerisporangium rubeum]